MLTISFFGGSFKWFSSTCLASNLIQIKTKSHKASRAVATFKTILDVSLARLRILCLPSEQYIMPQSAEYGTFWQDVLCAREKRTVCTNNFWRALTNSLPSAVKSWAICKNLFYLISWKCLKQQGCIDLFNATSCHF